MFRNKILERIKRGEKALGLFMSDPSEELKEMERKVHAAGKFMAGDYMESVNVFWNVKGALEQLLESRGRRSRMTW